ncbi:2'-5' RNA ligase family protein [Alicyclobacillus fodiniaquatilis]|uniref:2'-5' RNA ligase family protein n=1 Tax=Alicyclobacillus fodiniaquatilis TaxID=1661150 RepID=A0ABW4JCF9_9BACL
MKIGFAVIPDDGLLDALISFQAAMRGTIAWEPRLSRTGNLPHITLIQGDFKSGFQYVDILHDLHAYLARLSTSPLVASVQEIFYQPVGWYFVRVQKEPWLIHLHTYLFDLVKTAMTQGNITPDQARWYTPQELQNHRQYGYRYIGDAYLPHITLGRCADAAQSDLIDALNRQWKQRNLDTPQLMTNLTVYEMGEHGAHARTLVSLSI